MHSICGTDRLPQNALAVRNASIYRWDGAKAWNGYEWVGTPQNLGLTWFLADSFSVPQSAAYDVIAEAFASWAKVAALDFERVSNKNQADIVLTVGRIDGRSGTLAWSELPAGPDRQLTQKYDNAEPWYWSLGPPDRGKISALGVMAHEIGHALGIMHIAKGNLLHDFYSPSVLAPQAGDIKEIRLRYGDRVTSGPPPVEPPKGEPILIEVTETIPRGNYKLYRQ